MAHEEAIYRIMEILTIASKQEVADIMAKKGFWKVGPSVMNNSYKALCSLADTAKLVKGDGYFKLPGCKSEFNPDCPLEIDL